VLLAGVKIREGAMLLNGIGGRVIVVVLWLEKMHWMFSEADWGSAGGMYVVT